MGKTNWTRVFLGGLLTGCVATILGFVRWEVYPDRIPAMEALGLLARSSEGLIILGVVIYFIAGIIAIWTCSTIRPQCGTRVNTAITAGIAFWILSVLLPYISFAFMGMVPTTISAVEGLSGVVICIVATLAGAWVYKEQE
jgi:hypothetical protein